MKKYLLFATALLLGSLTAGIINAGDCHGTKKTKKTVAAPVAVEVEQDVTVTPGVKVKETVEVDGAGDVTVTEEVSVGEGSPAGKAPMSRRAAHKASKKVAKAMREEASAGRKAAKAAAKAQEAAGAAAAEGVTAKAFFGN
jgi:hypothetical protein